MSREPSPFTLGLLLWLALLACAPLPYFLVKTGQAPAIALAQMLAVTLEVIRAEGPDGAVPLFAWMVAGQLALGVLALLGLAVVLSRAAVRYAGRYAAFLVGSTIALMFVVALTVPIYRTPFRVSGIHATLLEVFE
jgi:hypothetical protein